MLKTQSADLKKEGEMWKREVSANTTEGAQKAQINSTELIHLDSK